MHDSLKKPLIFLIAGARPNFMKLAPIVREIKRRHQTKSLFDYRIIHTGQHYDRKMSAVFFEELGIPNPDYDLEVGSASHAVQTAMIMTRFETVCEKERPDLVLVVGDVNSTLACSIVAKKLNIKVAHVEAGLRSGDRTMPEEINRLVTDTLSDYFFVTEQSGVDNLIKEGRPEESIYFVGHVMIDTLFYQIEQLKNIGQQALSTSKLKERYPEYGVVTLHRPSNVDDKKTLTDIMDALSEVGKQLPLIFPVHPRTQANLDKFKIDLPQSIIRTEPLPYMEFLNLFKDAKMVLTDSGGIQEETTALGIPCLTLRENTERPITILEGTNVLVGCSKHKIIETATKYLNEPPQKGTRPVLWDGRASERIVEVLASKMFSKTTSLPAADV